MCARDETGAVGLLVEALAWLIGIIARIVEMTIAALSDPIAVLRVLMVKDSSRRRVAVKDELVLSFTLNRHFLVDVDAHVHILSRELCRAHREYS